MTSPLRVAVTGGAGQIGYSLLFRLAAGEAFGPETPLVLQLLEIPEALPALEGVAMELEDCAFPLLQDVILTDDPRRAFEGAQWALLVGAKPRTKGMERKDLIRTNGPIFVTQGRALAATASPDVRVVVVGNPANTNCLIAASNAAGIPKERFAALTFLDHNRARAQLAKKAGVPVTEVTNVTIWGNHSSTQYPDAENARIGGKPAYDVITDHDWLRGPFIRAVQQRGAKVIEARGHSSAASAANAVLDHIRAFLRPTPPGAWFSAAVWSDGSYGVPPGLYCSFPVRSDGKGGYEIVQGLSLSEFAREKFMRSVAELEEEKSVVTDLL